MNYFHHQFQQAQPIQQTGFNHNHFFQDHDPRFPQSQNMGQFPVHGRPWVDPFAGRTLLQSHRTETKPRLSKGEVTRLEAVFQANNKPSSSVKKDIANDMRVDVARINNWFQNRRAKKKQELKAKELEANAEAEKEKDKADATAASETNDDVSSDQDESAIKTEPRSPIACDNEVPTVENGLSPAGSSLAESCPRDDETRLASPGGVPAGYDCGQFEFTPTDDTSYFTTHPGNHFTGLAETSNAGLDSGLAVSGPMGYSMQGNADGLEAFSYEALMFPGLPDEMGSFETRVDRLGEEHFMGYQTEGVQASVESNYQKSSPETADKPSPLITQPFRLQSPPAIDIAGRRKRPGLALSGIRSTSNGPATGFDFGQRALDPGSPMRRINSAAGFGPQGIRRFPSQPRGGMLERRQGSLLHAVRSPNPAPFSSMAPPTPDTPVVATSQSVREATVSSSSSEEEGSILLYQPAGLAGQPSAMDQSIRTPPATPIGLGDVFSNSIGASLGYHTTEESFVAPGMDTFSMRSNEFSVPSYVADGYISHPATPQLAMSTGYYSPMPTNHTEYNWTGAAMVSTKSSPNPHQMRPLQFSNVTPQDFGGGK